MATVIRLKRGGRSHSPVYRVVVADSRAPRDGKFLEEVGFYDPRTAPAEIRFEADSILSWLDKGALPSDTVKSLLKQAGVYAKFVAKKKGEDVSNFETVPKPLATKAAKPSKKAQAKAQAEAVAKPAEPESSENSEASTES